MLRFLTRLIPWWLWLLAALALAMPALIAVTRWMEAQQGLAAAMQQAEPQVQPLEGFAPPADPGPFEAVRIGGQWSPALDVPEDPTALEAWLALEHFTVMVAPDGTWLGLWAPVWRVDAMRSALAAEAKANGMIAVSGFVMDAAATRRFAAALEQRGLRVPPSVAVIAPYFGPHAQAIAAREAELRGFAIGWGVAAALALLIAILRYRGWRARVQGRRHMRAGNAPSSAWSDQMAEAAGKTDSVGSQAQGQAEGQGAKPAARAGAAASEQLPPPITSRSDDTAGPITTPSEPPPNPGKGSNSDPVIRSARSGREFDDSPIISTGRGLLS